MSNRKILKTMPEEEITLVQEKARIFVARQNETVYCLVVNKGILSPSSPPDMDRVVQVLEEVKRGQHPSETKEHPTVELSETSIEEAQRKIEALITSLLPQPIAEEFRKLITGLEIEIGEVSQKYADLTSLIQHPGEKGTLWVTLSPIDIAEHAAVLDSILQEFGITLRGETLQRIALMKILAHEYGHLIDTTIQFRKSTPLIRSNPEVDAWRIIQTVKDQLHEEIYKRISPNPKLEMLLKDEVENGFYTRRSNTSTERISTGFELVVLKRVLLTEGGLSEHQAQAVIDSIKKKKNQIFDEIIRVVLSAREKGFTIETLGEELNNIAATLKRRGRIDLRQLLPEPFFGTRYFGYFLPLTEEEIRKYTEEICKENNNE